MTLSDLECDLAKYRHEASRGLTRSLSFLFDTNFHTLVSGHPLATTSSETAKTRNLAIAKSPAQHHMREFFYRNYATTKHGKLHVRRRALFRDYTRTRRVIAWRAAAPQQSASIYPGLLSTVTDCTVQICFGWGHNTVVASAKKGPFRACKTKTYFMYVKWVSGFGLSNNKWRWWV